MSRKQNLFLWENLSSQLEVKNRLKNKINKIAKTQSTKPTGFKLILKANFQEFGPELEKIVRDFLKFDEEIIMKIKINQALKSNIINSLSYTLDVAETIGISILEYLENATLSVECSIKQDNNFMQI